MADDVVAIATAAPSQAPQAVTLIKTFKIVDSNGNFVEVQGVAILDELGRPMLQAMTEATGQQLLAVLVSINNILCESTNCGAFASPSAAPGSP